MRGNLPTNQRNNLKILATLMNYLVRGVSDTSNKKMVDLMNIGIDFSSIDFFNFCIEGVSLGVAKLDVQ